MTTQLDQAALLPDQEPERRRRRSVDSVDRTLQVVAVAMIALAYGASIARFIGVI